MELLIEMRRYLTRPRLRPWALAAPILVLRAGLDTLVPPDSTDRLVAVLPADSRVIDFPEADHRSIAQDDDYWHAIQEFLGEPVV